MYVFVFVCVFVCEFVHVCICVCVCELCDFWANFHFVRAIIRPEVFVQKEEKLRIGSLTLFCLGGWPKNDPSPFKQNVIDYSIIDQPRMIYFSVLIFEDFLKAILQFSNLRHCYPNYVFMTFNLI